MRTKFVALFWALTCLICVTSAPVQAQFEVNLVRNGDAETGMASLTGNDIESVPGWTTTGNFTVVQYGAASGFPQLTDPGPVFRVENFFAGGPNNTFSSATQTLNVSANSAIINQGGVTFSLSGYLSGSFGQNSSAVVTATFRDASGSSLGRAVIGAPDLLTAVPGLFFRSQSGVLPVGTTSIFLELDMTRAGGPNHDDYNRCYADNISFVMHAPKLDLFGTGQPELALYNFSTQQVAFWFLNGTTVTDGALADTQLPDGWQVVGAGDFAVHAFNIVASHSSNLVLQNPFTGQVAFWTLNGTSVVSGALANLTLPSGWRVVGVGDIDGDVNNDLILYNPSTQQVAFWYMTGTNVFDGTYASSLSGSTMTLPANWQVAATGDIDGDGHVDLVLQNTVTLQVAVWFMNNYTVTAGALAFYTFLPGQQEAALPVGWQITGSGDFNGDGRTDLVLQNPSTGQVAFWYLGGVQVVAGTQLPDKVFVTGGALVSETLPANWLIAGPR